MYMSVEDQYFWEFILLISIGITFAFWYIKNYVKKYIDAKMKKQYQLGFSEGYDSGWYDGANGIWPMTEKVE